MMFASETPYFALFIMFLAFVVFPLYIILGYTGFFEDLREQYEKRKAKIPNHEKPLFTREVEDDLHNRREKELNGLLPFKKDMGIEAYNRACRSIFEDYEKKRDYYRR